MSSRNRILIIAVVFIAVAVLQKIFIPFDAQAVAASVVVPPELVFVVGGFQITNTLLTTWIAMILLIVLFYAGTRKMSLVPGGVQNAVEFAIEAILNLCESVAGDRAKKFFPIVATIFMFVVVVNLLGLIPGFGPIGTVTMNNNPLPKSLVVFDIPQVFAAQPGEGEGAAELAPFVRSPSSDVNFPLALALISVTLTQVFGVQALGLLGYLSKFFNFARVGKFLGGLVRGKPVMGDLAFGLIDVFVGLVELVSEFAKIIAFTFRLFGNIFAGEVLLLIMSFLFLALPLIFYGLEVFVGSIQGFVFAILTLAFMSIATTPHSGEEHQPAKSSATH
jgi:F-type H+-transporting ATPase subunit a